MPSYFRQSTEAVKGKRAIQTRAVRCIVAECGILKKKTYFKHRSLSIK